MKNLLIASIVFLTSLTVMFFCISGQDVINYDLSLNRIHRMPLVQDDPYAAMAHGGAPNPQRDARFRKWLSNGLKISVRGGSGSGTIIYHDTKTGWAYVQSCGHLWDGNMSAEEGRRRQLNCSVTTWYHNQKKLLRAKSYDAQVLYYSNRDGQDVALVRFKPDWKPDYLPIAPSGYQLSEGMRLHSVGCDGGREVAHYDVRLIGKQDRGRGFYDYVTTENSPRPGRSGGGLSVDNYFVGVCWGTSNYNGTGNGYFTSLDTVRRHNEMNGYGWLNDVGYSIARMIPIVDRNNPQGSYPKDYIPLPRGR